MTDRDFTDDRVINALVRCTGIHTSITCLECPYSCRDQNIVHFGDDFCKDVLLRNSLSIITRQKAELKKSATNDLPCTVGDTVYLYVGNDIEAFIINKVEITVTPGKVCGLYYCVGSKIPEVRFDDDNIGKVVFLSMADALNNPPIDTPQNLYPTFQPKS